jgi:hypothetical protein
MDLYTISVSSVLWSSTTIKKVNDSNHPLIGVRVVLEFIAEEYTYAVQEFFGCKLPSSLSPLHSTYLEDYIYLSLSSRF